MDPARQWRHGARVWRRMIRIALLTPEIKNGGAAMAAPPSIHRGATGRQDGRKHLITRNYEIFPGAHPFPSIWSKGRPEAFGFANGPTRPLAKAPCGRPCELVPI